VYVKENNSREPKTTCEHLATSHIGISAAAAATQRQNRTLHAVKQVAITLATAQSTFSETSHKHAHAPQTKHITGINVKNLSV